MFPNRKVFNNYLFSILSMFIFTYIFKISYMSYTQLCLQVIEELGASNSSSIWWRNLHEYGCHKIDVTWLTVHKFVLYYVTIINISTWYLRSGRVFKASTDVRCWLWRWYQWTYDLYMCMLTAKVSNPVMRIVDFRLVRTRHCRE